jgi:hypothetical protein
MSTGVYWRVRGKRSDVHPMVVPLISFYKRAATTFLCQSKINNKHPVNWSNMHQTQKGSRSVIHNTIHIEKKPPYLHGLLRNAPITPTYICKNIHPLLSSENIPFVQGHTHDIRPYVQRHPKTPNLLGLSIQLFARAKHSNVDGIHQIPFKSKALKDLPTGRKLSLFSVSTANSRLSKYWTYLNDLLIEQNGFHRLRHLQSHCPDLRTSDLTLTRRCVECPDHT